MSYSLRDFWDDVCDFFREGCIMYNASCDIEDGRDPRESLQHSKYLDDVPDEIKRPRY